MDIDIDSNANAIDTAPNVTAAIAVLTLPFIPVGARAIGPFSHPTRPSCSGLLIYFRTSRRYAIMAGQTITNVPLGWARDVDYTLDTVTKP